MSETDEIFKRCALWLLERPGCGWVLVHGTVNGRDQLDNEAYEHAWLELPGHDIALDMATDKPLLVPRDKYLDTISVTPVAQYDVTGTQLAIELHSNYGPWENGLSMQPEKRRLH